MEAVAEKVTSGTSVANGANGYARPAEPHEALIEALYREEGKAEIVDGRIVRFDMTGRKPGFAGDAILFALWTFVKITKPSRIAVGDGKAFLVNLPNRESFSPDAAYYEGPNSGAKFFDGAPRFAVEVRSENDSPAEMRAERNDYFAAGTEVVWDVDVLGGEEIVRKFTKAGGAQTPVAIYKRGETADAEPAVPGFTMSVDDLFE